MFNHLLNCRRSKGDSRCATSSCRLQFADLASRLLAISLQLSDLGYTESTTCGEHRISYLRLQNPSMPLLLPHVSRASVCFVSAKL
jgi:hypothetical protein